MIRTTIVAIAIAVAVIPAANAASTVTIPKTVFSLEQCMNAALALKAGEIQAVEMELNNGVPVYEFTIEQEDQSEWELTCHAMTGKIIAIEEEVEESAVAATAHEAAVRAAFDAVAKITAAQAEAIALNAHPGKVSEVERKLSAAQTPLYEIEITLENDVEREVEVDAVTGLILSVEEEIYAIGDD